MKHFDPTAQAKSNPYYERNNMGRVMCTLCRVACGDESNFLVHLEGKTHRLELERKDRVALKRAREEADDKAYAKIVSGEAAKELLAKSGGSTPAVVATFGRPVVQHQLEPFSENGKAHCRVWLEFQYPQAADHSRPLHRWRSSREQEMEKVDDSVVFLLVACEGYQTVALKFPSKLSRTSATDTEDGTYRAAWDAVRKVYTLFFIMSE